MAIEQVQAIRANLEHVNAQIAEAALRGGRKPEDVRLVVVTKTHPVEHIRVAVDAGATIFGENYAEEAVEKIRALGTLPGVEWHMIGHVQSRKAGLVAAHFAMMHALDSVKLAVRLDRFAREAGRVLPVLLEVNLSGEESKYGFPLHHPDQQDSFFADVEAVLMFSHLRVCGLMTMPPFADEAEQSRPYFRRLAALRSQLAERFPQTDWRELSMGTSSDYGVAVEEGATLLRVGTAILGARG